MFSAPHNIHFCFATLVPSAFHSYWSSRFPPTCMMVPRFPVPRFQSSPLLLRCFKSFVPIPSSSVTFFPQFDRCNYLHAMASRFFVVYAEIDECLSDPCENGGTCIDLINGYECRCTSQYTGVNCGFSQ